MLMVLMRNQSLEREGFEQQSPSPKIGKLSQSKCPGILGMVGVHKEAFLFSAL